MTGENAKGTRATARSGLGGPAMRWLGWPVLIPVVLGVLFALGDYAGSNNGRLDLTDPAFLLRLIACLALFVGGFEGAYHLLVRRPAQRRAQRAAARPLALEAGVAPETLARLEGVADGSAGPTGAQASASARASQAQTPRRHFFGFGWMCTDVIKAAVLVMLCWLPYLIWLYPGTLWYDTSWQVYEYYSGSLSDHHPFLLVYLYGAFIDLGRTLLGDGTRGMFLLICIQYVAAAFGFSLICSYVRRAGARWGWCLALLLFFCLFPFFPMMFCSIVKDTLQAVLFIYFSLLYCEIVRTRGELLKKTWPVVALVLLGLAICVVKKTGVYVVAVPLIALAFMKLRWGGRALVPIIGALLAAVMLVLFPRVVLPALDVEPGGKQESLAVPIQQVAHDVKYYPEDFSEQDQQLINDFLWIDFDEIPQEFDYTIVDPIKDGSLRDDSLIGEFMALWARLGAEHPLGHLEAWIGMEAGWFSFDPALVVKIASGEVANSDFLDAYVSWPDADEGNSIARDAFNLPKSIPVVSALYNQALWASVLPFFCLYVVAKTKTRTRLGRWCTLLMLSPYLMTMVSLMVCPVSTDVEAARYLIAMVSGGPLYVTLACLMARRALAGELAASADGVRVGDAQVCGTGTNGTQAYGAGAAGMGNVQVSGAGAAGSAGISGIQASGDRGASASDPDIVTCAYGPMGCPEVNGEVTLAAQEATEAKAPSDEASASPAPAPAIGTQTPGTAAPSNAQSPADPSDGTSR